MQAGTLQIVKLFLTSTKRATKFAKIGKIKMATSKRRKNKNLYV
jgi:hypothetical protein